MGINNTDVYSGGCALFGLVSDVSNRLAPDPDKDLHFQVTIQSSDSTDPNLIDSDGDGIPDNIDPTSNGENESGIVSVFVPNEAVVDGENITANVDYFLKKVQVEIEVSENCSWGLFKDEAGKHKISHNTMNLKTGINEAYIKVTGPNNFSKIYNLTVLRQDKEK